MEKEIRDITDQLELMLEFALADRLETASIGDIGVLQRLLAEAANRISCLQVQLATTTRHRAVTRFTDRYPNVLRPVEDTDNL